MVAADYIGSGRMYPGLVPQEYSAGPRGLDNLPRRSERRSKFSSSRTVGRYSPKATVPVNSEVGLPTAAANHITVPVLASPDVWREIAAQILAPSRPPPIG